MRTFVSFLLAIVVFIVGVTAFVFSGIYNVSAMVPHWPITIEILEETRDQSISYHSKGIVAPLLNVSKMEEAGFNHF